MRKLFTSIIVSTIVLAFSANVAYAINIEKIAMDENTLNMLEEQENSVYEMPDIDVSKLMCDEVDRLEFGNGVYLQVKSIVDWMGPSTPDWYKPVGFSNSPMYVYDENLNYIKSIEFEGYVTVIRFINGCFYIVKATYSGGAARTVYQYYKTTDGENWMEISHDEHTLIVNSEKLIDNCSYTWKQYSYEEKGIKHNTMLRTEYIVNAAGDLREIKRENFSNIYSQDIIDVSDLNVYTMEVRDISNAEAYNDLSMCFKYISLDGISMTEIPRDAKLNDMLCFENYLYIGVYKDEAHCYRIPIADMLGCVKVKYDNKYLSFTTPPVTESDRTLVPMRFLFEQMGAEVEWDERRRPRRLTKTVRAFRSR